MTTLALITANLIAISLLTFALYFRRHRRRLWFRQRLHLQPCRPKRFLPRGRRCCFRRPHSARRLYRRRRSGSRKTRADLLRDDAGRADQVGHERKVPAQLDTELVRRRADGLHAQLTQGAANVGRRKGRDDGLL